MKNKVLKFWRKQPEIIVSLLVYIIGLITFLQFETTPFLKYLLLVIFIVFGYLFIKQQKINYIIYPLLYLIFFTCYNFYFALNWPLFIVIIILLIFLAVPAYLFINSLIVNGSSNVKLSLYDKYSKYFYVFLFGIICIEVFLTLIPWPTDPRGKAIILLTVFYILQGLITAWLEKKLILKQVLVYLIVGLFVISGIIMTSPWYGY